MEGSPHFCLSEEQEARIDKVRGSMAFIAMMIDTIPPGHSPHIDADGLACLLSILLEQLPTGADLTYSSRPPENQP